MFVLKNIDIFICAYNHIYYVSVMDGIIKC